jgi:hypothetical protein
VEKWELPENVEFTDNPEHLHARLVLASYVKRDGTINEYTVSAPARNYMSYFERLLEWTANQINNQKTGPSDNWENVHEILDASEYPEYVWLALGAGEYTEWGQQNYIEPGDETAIILYDEKKYPEGLTEAVIEKVFVEQGIGIEGMACLHQVFVKPKKSAFKNIKSAWRCWKRNSPHNQTNSHANDDPCAGVRMCHKMGIVAGSTE